MGSKIIRNVASKSGKKMDQEMGSRVTHDIDSIMCMKMRKKDA